MEYLKIRAKATDNWVNVRCSKMKVTKADLSINSERTADGVLHREVVASKYYIDFSTPPMLADEMKKILQVLNNETFLVEFFEPDTGNVASHTFYSGDRALDYKRILNKDYYLYDTCSFSIIEI